MPSPPTGSNLPNGTSGYPCSTVQVNQGLLMSSAIQRGSPRLDLGALNQQRPNNS
jgi:hypothetical protein